MDKELNMLYEFQQHIYQMLNSFYSKNSTSDNHDAIIMMQAAVLLKTAMELYSTQFNNDEPIEKILESAKESLPELRFRIDDKDMVSKTVH